MNLATWLFCAFTTIFISFTAAASFENENRFISAAYNGSLDFVNLFLNSGVNVNAVNSDQRTALMCAALRGHLDVVQALIQNGADVNAVDKEDRTALMLAASQGRSTIVKELTENEAKVNAADKEGRTALMYASSTGRLDTIKYLISSEADIHAVDKEGKTALIRAFRYLDAVKYLIDCGANMDIVDNNQQTALIYATRSKVWEVAEYLIECGASLKQFFVLREKHFIERLRSSLAWNFTDFEVEYELILREKVDLEEKEVKINLLWVKVKAWIILGGKNLNEVIRPVTDNEISKDFPQVILKDGLSIESFLFNSIEYFQPKDEFMHSTFDLRDFDLTTEDVILLFRAHFGEQNINEFGSVTNFLHFHQNVIRFADFVQSEDLSNKIADLIVAFNISDFRSLWNHLKSIFSHYDEIEKITVVHELQFANFWSNLHRAVIRKKTALIEIISESEKAVSKESNKNRVARY